MSAHTASSPSEPRFTFEGQQLLELAAAFEALMHLHMEPRELLPAFEVTSSDGACSK